MAAVKIKLSSLPKHLQLQVRNKQPARRIIKSAPLKCNEDILIENNPQSVLYFAIKERLPGCVAEYNPPEIPRKFKLDMCFPDKKLAIEVDGWQYHGKYKLGFQKDRERQNILVLHGWRILRFFYAEIMNAERREGCVNMIEQALNRANL